MKRLKVLICSSVHIPMGGVSKWDLECLPDIVRSISTYTEVPIIITGKTADKYSTYYICIRQNVAKINVFSSYEI